MDNTSEHDWKEDFTHENGNYFCTCTLCGIRFTGHKRRVVCNLCANKAKPEDNTSESELKPCPFCGGEAELVEHEMPVGGPCFYYSCADEHCQGCATPLDKSSRRIEASRQWNRRHESARQDRGVEAIFSGVSLALDQGDIESAKTHLELALRSYHPYLTQQDRVEVSEELAIGMMVGGQQFYHAATVHERLKAAYDALRTAGFTITRDSKG